MKIRDYDGKDAVALANLYVRSVEQIGLRDYSARQLDAWASLRPSPERLDALSGDGRIRLVAVDGADRPVAFIDLEKNGDLEKDGHIDFLYCAPEVAGTGVASALYDALERIARARGVSRLYAEASEAARRFFVKKGFVVTSRRQLTISGTAIHNYAVEKSLADQQTG